MPFFSRQKFMITWAKLPHVPGAPPPHRHQNPPHTHAQRANGCFHFFSNRDIFWSIFKIQKLFLFLWAKTIGARNRNNMFSRAKTSQLPGPNYRISHRRRRPEHTPLPRTRPGMCAPPLPPQPPHQNFRSGPLFWPISKIQELFPFP